MLLTHHYPNASAMGSLTTTTSFLLIRESKTPKMQCKSANFFVKETLKVFLHLPPPLVAQNTQSQKRSFVNAKIRLSSVRVSNPDFFQAFFPILNQAILVPAFATGITSRSHVVFVRNKLFSESRKWKKFSHKSRIISFQGVKEYSRSYRLPFERLCGKRIAENHEYRK